MYYYLAHQIEDINKRYTHQFGDEDNCIIPESPESLEITSSKMVQDENRLKVISSKTPIEIGEEIKENYNEEINYQDFYWEERWVILQELHPNFWRM